MRVHGLLPWPPCLAPSAGLSVVPASRQARCRFGGRGHAHQTNEQASQEQGRSKGQYRRHEPADRQERARTAPSQTAAACGGGWDQAVPVRNCAPEKIFLPLTFHSTSPPKRALLSVSTASSLVAAPAWPERRARGGASIATAAVRIWRTRRWPPGRRASEQRPTQKQRPRPAVRTSRRPRASANPNVAMRGHCPALRWLGPIEPEQRWERLRLQKQVSMAVRWFTTTRLAYALSPSRSPPI